MFGSTLRFPYFGKLQFVEPVDAALATVARDLLHGSRCFSSWEQGHCSSGRLTCGRNAQFRSVQDVAQLRDGMHVRLLVDRLIKLWLQPF